MRALYTVLLHTLLKPINCYRQANEEVDRVLSDREHLTVADFRELRYCMRCVNESMRLYPHPPVLLRRANVPDTLPGDTGHCTPTTISGQPAENSGNYEGLEMIHQVCC